MVRCNLSSLSRTLGFEVAVLLRLLRLVVGATAGMAVSVYQDTSLHSLGLLMLLTPLVFRSMERGNHHQRQHQNANTDSCVEYFCIYQYIFLSILVQIRYRIIATNRYTVYYDDSYSKYTLRHWLVVDRYTGTRIYMFVLHRLRHFGGGSFLSCVFANNRRHLVMVRGFLF